MPIINPDYTNIDHEVMAKEIGLKVKHMPMLISSFLTESSPILETMSKQIQAKDYAGVRASAHSIKGSSGNLRFKELSEMARELEYAATEGDSSFDYIGYLEAMKASINTISL